MKYLIVDFSLSEGLIIVDYFGFNSLSWTEIG